MSCSRSSLSFTSKALRRCGGSSGTATSRTRATRPASLRSFSSTATRPDDDGASRGRSERPRWSYTPEAMKGPFSLNIPKDPRRSVWEVNEDPNKLDAMYNRLLGRDGDRMLPDEVKWLAVTHKSFDQGRRGFNTRLAYFGRQIIALEAVRSIMAGPAAGDAAAADAFGRTPFQHPALASVDKLSAKQPQHLVQKDRVAKMCIDLGLLEVMRWKPRLPENLEASGLTVALNTTLYAIVGAISLQHGAEVASRVVRDKILKRLGA